MILISLLLAIGALAALVIGWFQDGLTMVYISIGISVAALIFLVGGMVRRRTVAPATAGAPYGPPQGTAAAATAPPEPRERAKPRAPLPQRRPGAKRRTGRPKEPATPPPEVTAEPVEETTAKKPAAKKPASKKPAAAAGPSPRSLVVSIPERGTFHRSDCRYVKGRRDTERIRLETAEKRGYSACGVCKPAS